MVDKAHKVIHQIQAFRGNMSIKLGSIVMVLLVCFIAKISFETALAEKMPEQVNERSPASIDKSYNEHIMARR